MTDTEREIYQQRITQVSEKVKYLTANAGAFYGEETSRDFLEWYVQDVEALLEEIQRLEDKCEQEIAESWRDW